MPSGDAADELTPLQSDKADGRSTRSVSDLSDTTLFFGADGRSTKKAKLAYYVIYWSVFGMGYTFGCFAGVGVIVERVLNISSHELGILFAIYYFGMAAGAFTGGYIADKFGRVNTLLLANVLLFVAGVLMTVANGFYFLLAGRIVVGIGLGVGWTACLLYITETTPAKERGMYGVGLDLAIQTGVVLGYLLNSLLLGIENDWRIMVGIGCVAPAVLVLVILAGFPHESPRYLLLCGKKDEAKALLRELLEPKEAEETVALWDSWDDPTIWAPETKGFWGLFYDPVRVRMTIAAIGIVLAEMLSGSSILVNMLSLMIKSAGYNENEAFQVSLIVGVTKMVCVAIVAMFIVDRYGRRPLLLFSTTGVALSSLFIAAAFKLGLSITIIKLALCVYMIMFSIGLGPITHLYLGEVLETSVRAAGASLGVGIGRLLMGLLVWQIPAFMAVDEENVAMVFCIFGVVSTLAIGFVAFFCPETKNRKLEDVREAFAKPVFVY